MEKNKALKMIDEYLSEPNSIRHDWIDCLLYCRECIKKLDELKEENELLRGVVDKGYEDYLRKWEQQRNEKIKILKENLTNERHEQ